MNNLRPDRWLGPLAVVLGILAFLLPLVAFIGFEEPGEPFDDPAHVAYYRQTVAAFILGGITGLAALLMARRSTARLFRPAALCWVSADWSQTCFYSLL